MKLKLIVLIIGVALGLAGVAIGLAAPGCMTKSEGSRTGVIVKLSHKGMFCKTWEGDLALTGVTTSSPFSFSVDDEDFIKTLKESQVSGETVTISYRQEYFSSPCRGDTNYFLVGIEVDK